MGCRDVLEETQLGSGHAEPVEVSHKQEEEEPEKIRCKAMGHDRDVGLRAVLGDLDVKRRHNLEVLE